MLQHMVLILTSVVETRNAVLYIALNAANLPSFL